MFYSIQNITDIYYLYCLFLAPDFIKVQQIIVIMDHHLGHLLFILQEKYNLTFHEKGFQGHHWVLVVPLLVQEVDFQIGGGTKRGTIEEITIGDHLPRIHSIASECVNAAECCD